MRRMHRRLVVALLGGLLAITGTVASTACAKTSVAAPQSYQTKGTIRSFGPGRAYVNIAHEDIPGYMMAMTMSFEPGKPGQLDGLAENDRVELAFTETADGKRILTTIAKTR